MESTADGWTISRTGRYNNNEYASIELQGRALSPVEGGPEIKVPPVFPRSHATVKYCFAGEDALVCLRPRRHDAVT